MARFDASDRSRPVNAEGSHVRTKALFAEVRRQVDTLGGRHRRNPFNALPAQIARDPAFHDD